MPENLDYDRRRHLGAAVKSIAAAGFLKVGSGAAQAEVIRAPDVQAFEAFAQAVLDVAKT